MSRRVEVLRCELCSCRVPRDRQFSWSKCNSGGIGVVLCSSCASLVEGMSLARGQSTIARGVMTTIPDGPFRMWSIKVRCGDAPVYTTRHDRTEHVLDRKMLRTLADAYGKDHKLWKWLRARGVRRPSPSGPSGKGDPARMRTVPVEVRLPRAQAAALRAAAGSAGVTVSSVVAKALDAAGVGASS